jgi:methyltransferase (TIGR00027 family)
VSQSDPLIRNVSDTARWVAFYRARETERPNALFRDPFARRLAGERGEQIAKSLPSADRSDWAWVTRTYLFDRYIMQEVKQGVDVVINLAAGLDARPYRMELPRTLQWIEVDLPELLEYKESILATDKPVCALERIPMDLADVERRRALFAQIGRRAKRAMVVTEGLLIYLAPDAVESLGKDLSAQSSFQRWATDLASPGLLKMMMKEVGTHLESAGASFKFAPADGPAFFERAGWRALEVRSLFKTAGTLKRLKWWMKLFALLPESNGAQGKRPWSAVCLLARDQR